MVLGFRVARDSLLLDGLGVEISVMASVGSEEHAAILEELANELPPRIPQ
jgi:hypothetical protein